MYFEKLFVNSPFLWSAANHTDVSLTIVSVSNVRHWFKSGPSLTDMELFQSECLIRVKTNILVHDRHPTSPGRSRSLLHIDTAPWRTHSIHNILEIKQVRETACFNLILKCVFGEPISQDALLFHLVLSLVPNLSSFFVTLYITFPFGTQILLNERTHVRWLMRMNSINKCLNIIFFNIMILQYLPLFAQIILIFTLSVHSI